MVKEIAMYVDNLGEVADLNKAGFIKFFSKNSDDKWKIVKEIPFKFYSMQNEDHIRIDTLNINEALKNCKVFVAREIPNYIYMMFDSIGISAWKMDGNQKEILEYILEKEEEEAEEIKHIDSTRSSNKKKIVVPTEIGGNGYYILNLKEIQEHNTGSTTKQALKPFLNNNKFNELIVTCSHIPHWLKAELERLNLNFEFSQTGENDFVIVINHHDKLK